MVGEFRVTRKRSGGVPGKKVPLNGETGRVVLRELPMKASLRGMFGGDLEVGTVMTGT